MIILANSYLVKFKLLTSYTYFFNIYYFKNDGITYFFQSIMSKKMIQKVTYNLGGDIWSSDD